MKITTSHCRTRRYCQAVELHVADVDYGCCRWSLHGMTRQTQWPLSCFQFPSQCFLSFPLSILSTLSPGTWHQAHSRGSAQPVGCLPVVGGRSNVSPCPCSRAISFPVHVAMQMELLPNALILTTSPVSQSQWVLSCILLLQAPCFLMFWANESALQCLDLMLTHLMCFWKALLNTWHMASRLVTSE